MNAFRLMSEITTELERNGIILPGGVDFDSVAGKQAFLAALKTRVGVVRARAAAKAERRRDRGGDDPLARAYGHSGGEIVDEPAEIVDENERDERENEPQSALDRYFQPKKRPTDEGDEDDDAEPDDQRKRSALSRFLERKAR